MGEETAQTEESTDGPTHEPGDRPTDGAGGGPTPESPDGSIAAPSDGSTRSTADASDDTERFPVVVVGSSAGGFQALVDLLEHLEDPEGAAWLLVPHLDPARSSQLVELLSNHIDVPVLEVKDHQKVEPGQVYVRGPGRDVALRDGVWRTASSEEARGNRGVIDRAMRSVAEVYGGRTIGALLSGALSDGVQGLREIHGAGGLTLVQDPSTAQFRQLPQNAIDAGVADFVIAPAEMGPQVVKMAQHLARGGADPRSAGNVDRRAQAAEGKDLLEDKDEGLVQTILNEVHRRAELDFRQYKRTTVLRRIHRRIMATSLGSMTEYADLVQQDPEEARRLGQEILIHVTRFFRDAEVFEIVRKQVLPALIEAHGSNEPLRVWVMGCSTGEEAYSLAIIAQEALSEADSDVPVQIFATDLSAAAIEQARAGRYPASISEDVSKSRLLRYFTRTSDGYVVNKALRSTCIFSVHDVTSDAPFSNMDLVSCRNLLIYLDPPLQKQVLGVAHYALRPEGRLFLGPAESVGVSSERFEALPDVSGVYRRRDVRVPAPGQMTGWPTRKKDAGHESGFAPRMNVEDVQYEAQRLLLEVHGPPAIVINGDLEVLYCQGDVEPYVRIRPGATGLGLHKVADEALVGHVRGMVNEALRSGQPMSRRIRLDLDGVHRFVVEVSPLNRDHHGPRNYLVAFVDAHESQVGARRADSGGGKAGGLMRRLLQPGTARQESAEEIDALKTELSSTRAYLQSIIEDYEVTMEELRSANEEAMSTNEELQSTNEEVETAKEELQSTNEELTTVNDELMARGREVQRVNDDLHNLISSIDVPIVMLGPKLEIRRTTPAAEHLLLVRPSDEGRSIGDLNVPLDVDDLELTMLRVLDTLQETTLTVAHREGGTYLLKLRPYRTSDQRIDGLVVVLTPA